MAEAGARDALFELRNLYAEHAHSYGRIYREDVAEVVDKASGLSVLLCDLLGNLEPRPGAEPDVGTTTPAPAPSSPVELHTPEPVQLHTRAS